MSPPCQVAHKLSSSCLTIKGGHYEARDGREMIFFWCEKLFELSKIVCKLKLYTNYPNLHTKNLQIEKAPMTRDRELLAVRAGN